MTCKVKILEFIITTHWTWDYRFFNYYTANRRYTRDLLVHSVGRSKLFRTAAVNLCGYDNHWNAASHS